MFAQSFVDLADSFGTTFVVAAVLIALTLIPAFFLPREKVKPPVDDGVQPAVLMH